MLQVAPLPFHVSRAGDTPTDVAQKCGHLHRYAGVGLSLLPTREDFDASSVPGAPPIAPRFPRPPSEYPAVDPSPTIDYSNVIYARERLQAVSHRNVTTPRWLYSAKVPHWTLSYTGPIPPSAFISEKQILASVVPDFVCLPYVSTATRIPDGLVLTVQRSSTLSKDSCVIIPREVLDKAPKLQVIAPVSAEAQPPGTLPFVIPRVADYKPVFTVGRDPPSSRVTKCQAVKMPDVRCSKIHAVIRYCTATLMFEVADVGSANGTWVNGCRLSAVKESSPWCPLYDGSAITFGSVLGCASWGGLAISQSSKLLNACVVCL